MLSSEPLKLHRPWEKEKKVCFRAQEYVGRTQHTGDDSFTPLLSDGPCGQDDLLNLSVVFWNIPIHGVVGVIFLESPNMGRIPQTLKLSHPA